MDSLEVIAFIEEERAACPDCGHPRDQAWVQPPSMTDPWQAHDTTCWGCEAAERRKKSLAGEDGGMPTSRKVWVTFDKTATSTV